MIGNKAGITIRWANDEADTSKVGVLVRRKAETSKAGVIKRLASNKADVNELRSYQF